MHRFCPRSTCVFAALVFAACGGDAPLQSDAGPLRLTSEVPFCGPVVEAVRAQYEAASEASAIPEDPRYGGTVTVAGGGDLIGGFNGLTTSDQTTQEMELHLVHVTLLTFDSERTPQPYLAESWQLDADGRGATIRLRDDMVWHDGQPVTADDVAFTLRRAMDPATGFPNSGWFAFYDPLGVEVVDQRTLRLAFEPHAEVLDPWGSLSIMPEHLLGEVPPDQLREHPFGMACPVGAGPYLFESYRPGDQWTLRANPAFPDGLGGRPCIDRYVYRVITNSATRAGELVAGGVDVALGLDPVDASPLVERVDTRVQAFDQRAFTFVAWNPRLPGLSDARVRRAITTALDRASLVQTLRAGYGVVAETGIPASHWAHDPGLAAPAHDPEAAERLLDEAGWTDRDGDGVREDGEGNELRFEVITNANSEREGIGRILRDQLAQVGIAVDFRVVELGALQSRILAPGARDFAGFILGWAHDFNINERDFFHSDADQGHPYGWSAQSDPELDRLLDTLPSIRDRQAAAPLWRAYQERIVALQPFTYLYHPQRLNGLNSSLRGVEMDIRGELLSAPRWYWDPESR